jgi:hypothetical protein
VPPELRLLMCQVTPSTRNCLPLSLFPQRDIFASPAKSAFNVSCPIVIGPLAFVAVLAICYLPTATLMWGGTGQLSPIEAAPSYYGTVRILERGATSTRYGATSTRYATYETCTGTGTVLRYHCTVMLASSY